MPFIKSETQFPDRNYLPDTPDVDVDWYDLLGAGFRQENVTAGLISLATGEQGAGPPDIDYDPWGDMQGYEPFAWELADADSPDHMAILKGRIDRQQKDREILHMSGWKGVVTSMAGAVLDPIMLPFLWVPFAGSARIGGAASTALRGAMATGLEAGVAEAALHSQQATRTIEESYFNVGGAVLVGAALGAAAGALTRSQLNAAVRASDEFFDDTVQHADLPDVDWTGKSAGARAVEEYTPAELELYGASARVKFAKLNALGQMATSASAKVRALGLNIAENAFRYTELTKNLRAVPVAVESYIKKWTEGAYGFAVKNTGNQYKMYKKRMRGVAEPRLSQSEFRIAVGHALRRESTHSIPEVAEAAAYWRKNVFDPLLKRGMDVELFGRGFEPEDQARYLTRVYDRQKIKTSRADFEGILTRWIRGDATRGRAVTMSDDEIASEVKDIVDTLLGWHEGQLSYFDPKRVGKAGSMHERVLRIPDEHIEDFLVSDINHVGRVYTRSVGPRAELAHMSPDNRWDIQDLIEEANDDLRRMMDDAQARGDTGAVKRLSKELDVQERNVRAMRDRLLGTYDMPTDPTTWISRVPYIIKSMNYLTMMGGMAVSSLPDLARPIFAFGLRGSYGKLVTDMGAIVRNWTAGLEELQKAGSALDIVTASRAKAIADIDEFVPMGAKASKRMESLTNTFTNLTGMSAWNTAMKGFTGLMGQDRMLRAARAWGGAAAPLRKQLSELAGGPSRLITAQLDRDINKLFSGARGKAFEKITFETHSDLVNALRGIGVDAEVLAKLADTPVNVSRLNTLVDDVQAGIRAASDPARIASIEKQLADLGQPREIQDLLAMGIDEEMATRIANQPINTEDSLWLANTDAWTDADAVRRFQAALVKLADTTIVTPGVGDMPRFIHGDVWKLATQFRSFMMATVNRMMIPARQGMGMGANNVFDRRVYEGIAMSLAFGAATYFAKMKLAGREDDIQWDNEGKLIEEIVDRSGMLGPIMEVYNLASKLSSGVVSLSMLTEGERSMMSRYAQRNLLASFAGPTVGKMEDISTAASSPFREGDLTRADVRAMQKLLPYRNLWYINALLSDKEMVDTMAGALDAKKSR